MNQCLERAQSIYYLYIYTYNQEYKSHLFSKAYLGKRLAQVTYNCWSTSLGEASWSKVGHRHGTPGDLDGNQTGVVGRQWYDGNMSWKHEKNMSEISDLIWGWRELNWHDLRIQNLGKVENVLDTANLEKKSYLEFEAFFPILGGFASYSS